MTLDLQDYRIKSSKRTPDAVAQLSGRGGEYWECRSLGPTDSKGPHLLIVAYFHFIQ